MTTYQEVGHLFFPIYLWASVFACACSVGRGWKAHLWTALVFGGYVVFLFQLEFDGQAHAMGMKWYGLGAFVQLVMLGVASMVRVRGWQIITVSAVAAILLQATYAACSALHHPLPRQEYFVGVNLVQCLQVGALIVCAPVWPFLAGVVGLRSTQRRRPWTDSSPQRTLPQPQHRQAMPGMR